MPNDRGSCNINAAKAHMETKSRYAQTPDASLGKRRNVSDLRAARALRGGNERPGLIRGKGQCDYLPQVARNA